MGPFRMWTFGVVRVSHGRSGFRCSCAGGRPPRGAKENHFPVVRRVLLRPGQSAGRGAFRIRLPCGRMVTRPGCHHRHAHPILGRAVPPSLVKRHPFKFPLSPHDGHGFSVVAQSGPTCSFHHDGMLVTRRPGLGIVDHQPACPRRDGSCGRSVRPRERMELVGVFQPECGRIHRMCTEVDQFQVGGLGGMNGWGRVGHDFGECEVSWDQQG